MIPVGPYRPPPPRDEEHPGDHPGRVTGKLVPIQPKGDPLRFQWNPEQVTAVSAVGGWSRIARPRRKTATDWGGQPSEEVSFVLFFDQEESLGSVEAKCSRLESFGLPRAEGKPPPLLRLSYGPVGKGKKWVIDDLSWGPEVRRSDLHRVYQEVTVTLLEFVDLELEFTPAKKHKHKKKEPAKSHSARTGETLVTIAASQLGDASRWKEIAALNGVRSPKDVTPGSRVRLPS